MFCFRCDKLEIKIFVCSAAGVIYRNEGSELAKSLFNSVDCLDAFGFQGDYRIGKVLFGSC